MEEALRKLKMLLTRKMICNYFEYKYALLKLGCQVINHPLYAGEELGCKDFIETYPRAAFI
jgi:hypothetical protein